MKPDLKAIAERAERATPGPWASGLEIKHHCKDLLDFPIATFNERKNLNTVIDDSEFIAHARQDIPALLAYIADLEAVSGAAREFDKFSRKLEESKQLLGQSEYVISKHLRTDLRNALSKLDGDPS